MPRRDLLSSGWARGLALCAALVLLLVSLASGYSASVCLTGKACQDQGDCCPCPQKMCVADTASHDIVAAPGMAPSFRPVPLALFVAAPWHPPIPAAGFPAREASAFRSDPGRVPPGTSRPLLGVWLI